jgi:Nucleotidyl transferase AbiEii toxin, Type IV TA system
VKAAAFWKHVTRDVSDVLGTLVRRLEAAGVEYCVVGGQAVNAYVDPLVSLDLDIAVATERLPSLEALLEGFVVRRFAHTLNLSLEGSDLRVQIQTDPRYGDFVGRAMPRTVLGHTLPVASLEDVLQGKVWAAIDESRRPSKRQKDLADIARLLEGYPHLRGLVPAEVLDRLVR